MSKSGIRPTDAGPDNDARLPAGQHPGIPEEGVIVACGGMTGGYTMYIMDGRLVFDYNYLDGVHYKMTSPGLPTGPTELKFNFIKTGEFAGIGELYVNGEKVGEVDMPDMHISTYSLAETFDIGCDTGTQVDAAYEGSPFPFTGELGKVTITLTGSRSHRPPDEFVD